jgi:hypothetical protein
LSRQNRVAQTLHGPVAASNNGEEKVRPDLLDRDRRFRIRLPPGPDAAWIWLTRLLFVAIAVLIATTFSDYGVTWDEDLHFAYGYKVFDYYASLGADRSFLHLLNLYTYGSAFDLLTASLAKISPIGAWETRHLVDGCIGLLGIVAVARIGRLLGGARTGFFAAALLSIVPDYYGQMFNNPKDIPFAVALTWSLYYIIRLLPELPRPRLALSLKLGLSIGLALGVRVGGLLGFCYLGLAVLVMLLLRRPRPFDFLRAGGQAVVWVLLPVLSIATPLMLLLWPWTQLDPIGNTWQALAEFSHHDFPYKTLYDGTYYLATALPPSYLPVHILLKLPELLLLLLCVAPLFAVRAIRKCEIAPHTITGWGLVAFAAGFPVAFAVAEHAVLFDGMRHFLFVLPPLAILGGGALDSLVSWFKGRPSGYLAAASGAAWLAAHLVIMVGLHPDQYVYYNALAGGVPGASGRFILDYWAASYREDVRALADYLERRDGAEFRSRSYRIAVCGPPGPATAYFPSNFVYERDWSKADFFISFTKDHCDGALAGSLVYRAERLDTTLSVVLNLRHQQTAGATLPPRSTPQ